MQGFRRSGHVHDEAECLMSIAEFMAELVTGQTSYRGTLRRPASYLKALGFLR